MASLGELGDCPGHLSNREPEWNGHLGPKSISEPGLEPGPDVLGNSPPISRLLPSDAQKTTCHRAGGLCAAAATWLHCQGQRRCFCTDIILKPLHGDESERPSSPRQQTAPESRRTGGRPLGPSPWTLGVTEMPVSPLHPQIQPYRPAGPFCPLSRH